MRAIFRRTVLILVFALSLSTAISAFAQPFAHVVNVDSNTVSVINTVTSIVDHTVLVGVDPIKTKKGYPLTPLTIRMEAISDWAHWNSMEFATTTEAEGYL